MADDVSVHVAACVIAGCLSLSGCVQSGRLWSLAGAGDAELSDLRVSEGIATIADGSEFSIYDEVFSAAGPVENDGVLDLLDSVAIFPYGLTCNGALLFDPSTITVSTLTVGPGGVLTETGGPGDRFIITEDFINQSTLNEAWKTDNTIFQFNGGFHDATDPQTVEAAGADVGKLSGGWTDNFVLGVLQVGPSGTYLRLVDDYGNSAACLGAALCEIGAGEALYVRDLILEAGVTLDLNGLDLYVENSVTDFGAIVLNGTIHTGAMPLPGDVDGDTRLTAADVLLARRHVMGQAILGSPQIARGDVYPVPAGDGLITLSDVLLIESWLLP